MAVSPEQATDLARTCALNALAAVDGLVGIDCVVRIVKDLDEPLEGKEVLIVEDIIDSGRTLAYLIQVLMQRNPASIRLCTLLDKPERRVKKQVTVDYTCFTIPDEFVVGYGLDYAQKYRNLPFIGIVEPDVSGEEAEAEPERKGEIVG